MIRHELLKEDGILIVTPEKPLKTEDFDRLAKAVDPYLEEKGTLKGLMIYTEAFPGWNDFAALISHLQFVRRHHQKIARVAAVTNSSILSNLPRIASHFINAEVKHFAYKEKVRALEWLGE